MPICRKTYDELSYDARMTQESEIAAKLRHTEQAQEALRKMLTGVDHALLRERPPSGEWSPIEQVRHLIFAEQHHFGPYLERGFRWSSAGVPPPNRTGERRLSPVGSDPKASLDEVFDAWAKVHGVVRALAMKDPPNIAKALDGDLRHLTVHAEAIERLLPV